MTTKTQEKLSEEYNVACEELKKIQDGISHLQTAEVLFKQKIASLEKKFKKDTKTKT
tara:strand:- start:165 stop:335 length:171 start_codon:yes stop_codon:yes gene_type:complete